MCKIIFGGILDFIIKNVTYYDVIQIMENWLTNKVSWSELYLQGNFVFISDQKAAD
jgi:hypothetical protein